MRGLGPASHVGGAATARFSPPTRSRRCVLVGFEEGTEEKHDQWRITDIAELVRGHFGVAAEAKTAGLTGVSA